MRFDRRVSLFAVLAVVSFALVPVADDKYAHVPLILGITYVVLSLLFLVDWLLRAHNGGPHPGGKPED